MSWVIWHTRGVANLSLTASSSSLMTVRSLLRVGEDRLQLGDPLAHLGQLGLQVDAAEPGELGQAHLQDVAGLDLAEPERGHQPLTRRLGVLASRG